MSSRKNKGRVLMLSFIFSPNVGGVESHLNELCDYLARQGNSVTVISYKPIIENLHAPFRERRKNIVIYRIPWIRLNLFNKLINHPLLQIMYLTPGIFIFSFVFLLSNRNKIDVMQAHGFNMAIVAFFLSLIFNKPFTVNTHVSFSFRKNSLYSKILAFILKKSNKVLVLTEESRLELIKIGVPTTKLVAYRYWVDKFFKPFQKISVRKELNLPGNKFILLFVGRFIKEKGVVVLINAMKKTPKNIELIMIGSGPLEAYLRVITRKMNNITILSSVERKELPKWYSAADITIIPSYNASKIYSEGIPRVMIESLSCGTPVVATMAGGLKSTLTEKVGFFIEPNSSSISKMILRLKNNQKKLEQMRANTKEFVNKSFDLNKNAKKIELSLTI